MCHHFLEEGKNASWKLVHKCNKFEECFDFLGTSPELAEEKINLLEKYVCYLFGVKSSSVNNARSKIFDKKYQREGKDADLTSLPPCYQVFLLHALRYNYVAYMWRKSVQHILALPDLTNNEWHATG